jgi:hypothetical protein
MRRKEPGQPRRLHGNGCTPIKRSDEKDRPPCMVAPRLGFVDFRVLCFYSAAWGTEDWDSMQFVFDDLDTEIKALSEEKRYPRRGVLVHGGNGNVAVGMADRMVRARYGWEVESHRMDWGRASMRVAVTHMSRLGVNQILIFKKRDVLDQNLDYIEARLAGFVHPKRVVYPAHDIVVIARKGLTSPPMLGVDIGVEED